MTPHKKAKVQAEEASLIEAERTPRDSRVWWGLVLAAGVVVFGLTALLAHRHTLGGVNLSLLRHINDWPARLRMVFVAISIAPSALWIGVAPVIITFALKLYQLAWQLAAAVFGAVAAGFLAKHVIAEPRPQFLTSGLHVRVHETDASFPSGHVLVVTAIVLTLWPYVPRGWRWLTLLAIPLISLSRLYLGVHTPLDVLGGAAVGMAVVGAMRVLPEPLRRWLRFD